MTAAAAVALLLTLGVWWQRPTVVMTAEGETQTVELEDGTVIELNGASELQYHSATWDEQRQLTLRGEAYFDVAPGDSFQVQTEQGTVTVLGTEFNVFVRANDLVVGCYEGKVAVDWQGATQPELLTAGKILEKSGSNSSIIRKLKGIDKPGWLDGAYRYEQAPLAEVIDEMSRRFGVQFLLDPVVDTDEPFTGVFYYHPQEDTDGQLDQALDMVMGTMGYQHRKEGDMVYVYP